MMRPFSFLIPPIREWPAVASWRPLVLLTLTILVLLAPVTILTPLAAFVLVAFFPGYALLRWLQVAAGWRDLRFWAQAIALSLALTPVILYASAQFLPFTSLTIILALGVWSAFFLLFSSSATAPAGAGICRRSALLVLGITVVLAIALIPLRNSFRDPIWPLPITTFNGQNDWNKHFGMAWLVEQTGIPPKNLYVLPQWNTPVTYYYFLYLTVAVLDILSGMQLGLLFWLVLTAIILVPLFILHLYLLIKTLTGSELAGQWGIALGCTVGGLQLLPSLSLMLQSQEGVSLASILHSNLEVWAACNVEVSTFFTMATWVPQHLMAALVFVIGWYWVARSSFSARWVLLPPLLLVSIVGHSAFVGLTVLAGLGILASVELARLILRPSRQSIPRVGAWIAGLVIFLALGAPLLNYLRAGATSQGQPLAFWVRSSGVVEYGWTTGTVFQNLLDTGELMPQILDLPLYYLIELGVLLPLALVGLARLRRDWNPAWTPGLVIGAVAFFATTFLRSTRGCNDFGMRGIVPFQIACVALAAYGAASWLSNRGAEKGVRSMRRTDWRVRFRDHIKPVALLSVTSFAAILLAFQVRYTYFLDLGSFYDSLLIGPTFYDAEAVGDISYRWTSSSARVVFPGVNQNEPYFLTLRLAAGTRPEGAPPSQVKVYVNGQLTDSFLAQGEFRRYRLLLDPAKIPWKSDLTLELQVPTYRPLAFKDGGYDNRNLGLQVDSVRLEPWGPYPLVALPPLDQVIWLVGAVLSTYWLGQQWALSRFRSSVLATVGLALLAATFVYLRFFVADFVGIVFAVLCLAAAARFGLPIAAEWLSLRPRLAGPLARSAKGAVLFLLVMGFTTTFWQFLVNDVTKFLPAMTDQERVDDEMSISYGEAIRSVRSMTPGDAVIQQDPSDPFVVSRLELAIGRRSAFTFDHVFGFWSFPKDKLGLVQEVGDAFRLQQPDQVCSRFNALRVNYLLVDLARAPQYGWVNQAGEPGCLSRVFANRWFELYRIAPAAAP